MPKVVLDKIGFVQDRVLQLVFFLKRRALTVFR